VARLVKLSVAFQQSDTAFTQVIVLLHLLKKSQEKGKLTGKEQDAVNMLREGFREEVVARSTRLPAERIARLCQQPEARE
jgi:hypothetical protein